MITHLTAGQLRRVAEKGAGLEIDAEQFTAPQLRSIAAGAEAGKVTVVIHNSGGLTSAQMMSVTAANPGGVVFK